MGSTINVTAATRHFTARMIAEGSVYSELSPNERLDRTSNWLNTAVTNQDKLTRDLSNRLQTIPTYAPATEWRDIINDYTGS